MGRRKNLTFKQERFVQEYIRDGNATRAVKEAYPNAKSYEGMRVMGSNLLTNINVADRIKAVLEEQGLTPELIVTELKKLIEDDDKSEKAKALRLAAEIMGLIGKGGVFAQVNIEQRPLFEGLESPTVIRMDNSE